MSEWFVSPTGLVGNAGTEVSPWDLASAITGHSGSIQPGDTVWMLGGLYTQAAQWTWTVSGTLGVGEDDPTTKVKFKNKVGALVTIECTNTGDVDCCVFDGSYCWLWATVGQNEGIVLQRPWVENGRASARGTCAWFRATPQNGNKLIHVVTHDGANGVYCGNGAGTSADMGDLELYGGWTYNNGNDTAPRTHGLYLRHQSPAGKVLRVMGYVVMQQLGHGIQLFGTFAGSTGMDGIWVEDSVMFAAGRLGTATSVWGNGIFGGGGGTAPIRNGKWNRCIMYHIGGTAQEAQMIHLGASGATNEDCEYQDNYIVLGGNQGGQIFVQPFRLDGLPSLKCDRNIVLTQASSIVVVRTPAGSQANMSSWTNNVWGCGGAGFSLWREGGTDRTFATWKTNTGLGASDTVDTSSPSVDKIFVKRMDKYNSSYGQVVVFRWSAAGNPQADLRLLGYSEGDTYEVYNVQSLNAAPVATGLLPANGLVSLPITGVTPPLTIGTSPRTLSATGPFFDVYHARRTAVGAGGGGGGGRKVVSPTLCEGTTRIV